MVSKLIKCLKSKGKYLCQGKGTQGAVEEQGAAHGIDPKEDRANGGEESNPNRFGN